jgi:7-keto-8-aminopelargonate synthetase-like enzyme
MLLDEAFNKMDMTNIIATMRYLEELGLQVFMASPGENLGTLTAFLHRYYDILRDADNNAIMIEGHDVSAAVRATFREDLPEFNPALVEQEVAAMRSRPTGQRNQDALVQ